MFISHISGCLKPYVYTMLRSGVFVLILPCLVAYLFN
jgi:hypothetical protein